jgi:hypothetical protein
MIEQMQGMSPTRNIYSLIDDLKDTNRHHLRIEAVKVLGESGDPRLFAR